MKMGNRRQWIVFGMIIVSCIAGAVEDKAPAALLTPLLLMAILFSLPEDPKGGA